VVCRYTLSGDTQTKYLTSDVVPLTETLSPGDMSKNIYAFTLSDPPSDAMNITYQLVYRGALGQETDAVAVGAIRPASGFVVDDGQHVRLVYKKGNAWKVRSTDYSAGNIDWKGMYVDGKPSRTLSWNGPLLRHFPSGTVEQSGLFTEAIFQDGDVWVFTPARVLAAAITKDADGKSEWLVAICMGLDANGEYQDVVYRRPNRQSTNSKIYDPVNEPDGWHEIGRITPPAGTRNLPHSPWFFNGDGTEAQTMRRKEGYVTRLKATITGTSVTSDDLNNLSSEGAYSNTGSSSEGSCSSQFASSGRGESVLAVDYLNNEEQLLTFANNRRSTSSDAWSSTGSGDFTRCPSSARGDYRTQESESSSDKRTLSMPSQQVSLYDFSSSGTFTSEVQYSSVWSDCSKPPRISSTVIDPGTLSSSAHSDKRSLYYVDIRNRLMITDRTYSDTSMSGTPDSSGMYVYPASSANRSVEALSAQSIPTIFSTTINYDATSHPATGVHCEPSNYSWSGSGPVGHYGEFLQDPYEYLPKAFAVDAEGNVFISLQVANPDGSLITPTFIYLTGGLPAEITIPPRTIRVVY